MKLKTGKQQRISMKEKVGASKKINRTGKPPARLSEIKTDIKHQCD